MRRGQFAAVHGGLTNAPANAVIWRERIEIDQESDAALTEAQIGKDLGLVQWHDVLDGFPLQNHGLRLMAD